MTDAIHQSPSKNDYLLLFRNTEWHKALSPDEIQQVMTDWMKWYDALSANGRCTGGQSLEESGKVVRDESRHVTDGPYAEAKESVAGYFVLNVSSIDEAVEIAKMCPALPHGISVEVRQLLDRCKASKMADNS